MGQVKDLREIQETVYIAISTILLAIVLGIVSFGMEIRNDMAEIRNEEIMAAKSVEDSRKFNKYDDKIIYGDEVIELISLYANTGISIYIDDPNMVINDNTIKANPSIVSLGALQNNFPSISRYRAQVVYNAEDPANITGPMKKLPGSEVTGISLRKE